MQNKNLSTCTSSGALTVDRAMMELRRGRAVEVNDGDHLVVVCAVETQDADQLADFADAVGQLRLWVTRERAAALGVPLDAEVAEVDLPSHATVDQLASIAGLGGAHNPSLDGLQWIEQSSRAASAALKLARLAELLPALLYCHDDSSEPGGHRLPVTATEIDQFPDSRGRHLVRVSSAPVQLDGHEHCEFVVFRERFGDVEHVAIRVGNPDDQSPVLARLHSSCLTGDLFGSLRCDCGDQLRSAVSYMGSAGGGVLLYLDQEGRGIGLANKLRAYQLQDDGLDTLEANHHLGFLADERGYAAAATMLQSLGITQLRLLTNNPIKVDALVAGGIDVVDQLPMPAFSNPHNARYLRTKYERAGHKGLLDADG